MLFNYGSCSPVRSLCVLCCVRGVWCFLAPVHRCGRSVCCAACAVSGAIRPLLTGVLSRCAVLRVRCPGPLGSWSPVCSLGVLCCVCGVRGLFAPVHWCARSVRCPLCALSGATGLLFTGVHVRRVLLCMWRVVCAVSGASLLPFAGVLVRCVLLRVLRPGPLGSRSPVCSLGVLCCVCGVRGILAPVLRCAHSLCCVARAVFWASWLLFTGVRALCLVLRLWRVVCAVCALSVCMLPLCILVMTHCCGVCAVSGASWLLFTGVLVRCVVWCVRCPGPHGSCSPVCSVCCVVFVVLVWVCPRVCHTVLVAFLVAPKSRRRRRTPLGFLCAFMTRAIWSLCCGLFVLRDAQEEVCLNVRMAAYAIYSLVWFGLIIPKSAPLLNPLMSLGHAARLPAPRCPVCVLALEHLQGIPSANAKVLVLSIYLLTTGEGWLKAMRHESTCLLRSQNLDYHSRCPPKGLMNGHKTAVTVTLLLQVLQALLWHQSSKDEPALLYSGPRPGWPHVHSHPTC